MFLGLLFVSHACHAFRLVTGLVIGLVIGLVTDRHVAVCYCVCVKQSVAHHRENPNYKSFAGALLALLENGQESLDLHQFHEL